MCYLLGIRNPEELRHHPLRGQIFESWVAAEVFKARVHGGLDPRLFHFRDAQGPEVDLVVETGSRVILGEVKSGATVHEDYLKGLRRLQDILEDGTDHLEILSRLIYGGNARQSRSGADVVPWDQIADVDWR